MIHDEYTDEELNRERLANTIRRWRKDTSRKAYGHQLRVYARGMRDANHMA